MKPSLLILLLALTPSTASAVVVECQVTKKVTADITYTPDQLAAERPSVLLNESKEATTVSRCSFVKSLDKVTCDTYPIDRVEKTERLNGRTGEPETLAKYYIFRSHFDLQIFPDSTFVENNGRGMVSFGRCRLKSP